MLGFAFTQFISSRIAQSESVNVPANVDEYVTQLKLNRPAKSVEQFNCDGRQYCSDMRSLDEAEFFLANCPNVKMDGDKDGLPCERQFGHRQL